MQPVILSDEQFAMLKRLEAEAKRFDENPVLRSDPEAIEGARKLVDEAHSLKMPEAPIHGVRLYVSMYDIEMGLPEHLRDLDRLGGKGVAQ